MAHEDGDEMVKEGLRQALSYRHAMTQIANYNHEEGKQTDEERATRSISRRLYAYIVVWLGPNHPAARNATQESYEGTLLYSRRNAKQERKGGFFLEVC